MSGSLIGLGLFLDRLRDASTEAWALVDDLAQARHDVDDGAQRAELRAAQDHVSQAWAQLQHARTTLTALAAGLTTLEWIAAGHAMCCPPACNGCWCSHAGACWHHR